MVIPSHVLIHLTQNIKEDYTMEKYYYNSENRLWYELQGDYYIPCLTLGEEDTQPIGRWGRKHQRPKNYLISAFEWFFTTILN